ncbi:hypothetical protein I3F58_13255 [Streptomyces sp. MUM 203J]|uniref:hypothetical protein n=1 Tax=Streptomyces sp. MUM 203J TaxID=2791990 RepID=UPI001F044A80|nr:hypothetical protein [Streptomyces sp. MUM 203J]MCH0540522.1 hypothetical protein [Streptomyces sp. MUM 203J]
MSEEPASTNHSNPTKLGSTSRVSGTLEWGCAAPLAVAFTVFLVPSWQTWESANLPRATGEEMANRAFRLSQEAYEVLGFTATFPDQSIQNTVGSQSCYYGALRGMGKETIGGAYRMHHEVTDKTMTASMRTNEETERAASTFAG